MDDKLFFDKLSGPENWATWKFQMEHLLKAKGLRGMLTETQMLTRSRRLRSLNRKRGHFLC